MSRGSDFRWFRYGVVTLRVVFPLVAMGADQSLATAYLLKEEFG